MKHFPVAILLFVGTGCAALQTSAPESWVKADRATYEAVAPEYGAYVDADATLDQAQKDSRHRTLTTWRIRLEEHEKTLAQPK